MKKLFILLLAVSLVYALSAEPAGSLPQSFQKPPPSARPWVYWFWNNGNVTSNGITADLEAMQRVGIGGVLIMDVLERFAPPRGTAEFMNPEWQNLFQFSVQEAARLGLEINMANGPGWCGSSGPWITPELSMQKIVSTSTVISGPTNFSAALPQPNTDAVKKGTDMLDSSVKYKNCYADIAVLAFPQTADGMVPRSAVVDLTAKLGADGKLNWAVPAGDWIIQRIGHTTTGSSTRPPVAGGNGLECDKLSAAAMDAHFAGMMAKLIKTAGPLAGKSLVTTHIDSWEVGSQNWTPRMRAEFQKRRGYDLLPWLPCVTEAVREKINGQTSTRYLRTIGNAAQAARFRWDFAQTIAELLAENYSGRLAELAHQHGLRYSLEGYELPFGDQFAYTARADEPMTEFWTGYKFNAGYRDTRAGQASSVAHVYGRAIVGAEAFTSGDKEMWKATPADIKALGDFEFCSGVNRFVVHRYAHQPYLDRFPGATMGPWGLHYERTQTWWEMSGAWHEYLARCQFLLRQGKFVADLLYLRPEMPNQTYFTPNPPPPADYRYDEISAEALMQRVLVKNGKLVLPDGMNYRVLVLPPVKTMTPGLLEKIRQLAKAGATIVATGPRPQSSPSLQDFPRCDVRVAKLGREIWGDEKNTGTHALGKGQVFAGAAIETVLAGLSAPADFAASTNLNWIHRRADGAEIYFVANPSKTMVETCCTFRVNGLQPELWDPETGTCRDLPEFSGAPNECTTVPLRFEPVQSFFIVFRKPAGTVSGANNFSDPQTVSEIAGPWNLQFPPKWGAPESVTLTNLISWSDSADDGIKYFSGTATYRAEFGFPAAKLQNKNSKLFLNLGDVQVMARVKVNGRDCGIAWKAPFRIEITDALRPGANTLEIQVANLWPNCLIGDAALPEKERFTWSSWEPFKKDTPLLKSGLLGPVRIEVEN
jgi:alpha-L-rhamnosidase